MYGYPHICEEIKGFKKVSVIGNTREKRNIFCIEIGNGEKNAVFSAAFHGLEYLTATALIEFAKRFSEISEYHSRLRLFVVPMVNPDGVEIAINGIDPKNAYHRDIIKHTGIIDFTKVWQANASGVDINHNFNAGWDSICDSPAPTKYGGEYPESEPETRAIANLLRKTEPELFIAFHSQGKEIYYDFNGLESESAKENAEFVAKRTGYKATVPDGTATFGGAKDYYIQEYHKEAYTVELGMGKNPLPHSALPEMINDVYNIGRNFIDRVF